MEQYLSTLSNDQKSLLDIVEEQKLANVRVALNHFPNFTSEPTFSYLLLLVALHRRHKSITALLVDKCNVVSNLKTNRYYTPLFYAVLHDDLNLFTDLYHRGASLFDRDFKDQNALELLMQRSDAKIGSYLECIMMHRNDSNLDPTRKEDVAIFHLACYKGDVRVMKRFIEANFSVNSHSEIKNQEWAGATPLQFALKGCSNTSESVNILLKRDVDFNAQDQQGNTPLHTAIGIIDVDPYDPDEQFVDHVFKKYVRRFNSEKFFNPVNKDGISHFQILCSLNWDDDDEENFSKLLKILKFFIHKKVDVNGSNHLKAGDIGDKFQCAGYTPLHWAAEKCNLRVVRLLLKNGADATKTDAKGNTPLHTLDFTDKDSLKTAELLLKCGASVDMKNSKGETPLHRAFYEQKRNKSLMNLLWSASHEVSNLVNSGGLSYLHMASTRDLGRVKTLIENGASVKRCIKSSRARFNGYSALHFAIIFNQADIVEYLLKCGAEVNPIFGEDETTPLHLACTEQLKFFYGAPDDDDLLLARRPSQFDPISQMDVEDEDLDWVLNRKNQMRIVQLLLEHGASVNVPDSMKLSPLIKTFEIPSSCDSYDYSKEFQKDVIEEIITRQKMMVELLSRFGANIDSRGHCQESALHLLVEESHRSCKIKDLVEILLKNGANVEALDNDGFSPLHRLVRDSPYRINGKVYYRLDTSLIDLFLAYGANVNSQSKDLSTPLHTAVENFHSDADREKIFVKLANQAHVNKNAQNGASDTPLHLAVSKRHLFCIKTLLDAGANVNVENAKGHSPMCVLYNCFKEQARNFKSNDISVCKMMIDHVRQLIGLNQFVSKKVRMCFDALSVRM